MSTINWSKNYNVGVKELDQQHKRLLEIINELSDARENSREEKTFFEILNGLIKYAELHFMTEEKYMTEHKYPDLPGHEKEHVEFTEKVFSLHERLTKKEPNIYYEIMDFLKGGYIAHVLGVDQRYKDFFAEKGVK